MWKLTVIVENVYRNASAKNNQNIHEELILSSSSLVQEEKNVTEITLLGNKAPRLQAIKIQYLIKQCGINTKKGKWFGIKKTSPLISDL